MRYSTPTTWSFGTRYFHWTTSRLRIVWLLLQYLFCCLSTLNSEKLPWSLLSRFWSRWSCLWKQSSPSQCWWRLRFPWEDSQCLRSRHYIAEQTHWGWCNYWSTNLQEKLRHWLWHLGRWYCSRDHPWSNCVGCRSRWSLRLKTQKFLQECQNIGGSMNRRLFHPLLAPVLSPSCPSHIQRLQRRKYQTAKRCPTSTLNPLEWCSSDWDHALSPPCFLQRGTRNIILLWAIVFLVA